MRYPSNKLIEELIREKIDKTDKPVDAIMGTLSLGKEAAYRRLRGEVPYTFDDLIKISQKYNVSLDTMVGNKTPAITLTSGTIVTVEDPFGSYKSYLKGQTAIFREVNKRNNGKIYLAFNLIPYVLYSNYRKLNEFRLYRWMHQMNTTGKLPLFKDVHFPEDLWQTHLETIQEFSHVPEVVFVFDKGLFLNQVKDILLFVQLNLIDQESLMQLKSELLELLDDIRQMTGLSPDSKIKRPLFVSNVSFESSYLYFEADDYQLAGIRLLGIGILTTENAWVCEQQKKWVESLRRYSTLISVSGELDRLAFINQQKEYIRLLDMQETI